MKELVEALMQVMPPEAGERWIDYIGRARREEVISTEDRYRLMRMAVGMEILMEPVTGVPVLL